MSGSFKSGYSTSDVASRVWRRLRPSACVSPPYPSFDEEGYSDDYCRLSDTVPIVGFDCPVLRRWSWSCARVCTTFANKPLQSSGKKTKHVAPSCFPARSRVFYLSERVNGHRMYCFEGYNTFWRKFSALKVFCLSLSSMHGTAFSSSILFLINSSQQGGLDFFI